MENNNMENLISELSELLKLRTLGILNKQDKVRLKELSDIIDISSIDDKVIIDGLIDFKNKEKLYNKNNAYKEFKSITRVKSINVKKLALWMSSAAAVVVFITTLFFLSKTEDFKTNSEITHGSERAIITLANGKSIVLDSNSYQLKDKEGINIKVVKGLLNYMDAKSNKKLLYNNISTPRGGEFKITLSDGTKVWMNSESKLKYPINFLGPERKVFLTGEAYFEVSKDKNHPFIVVTEKGDVRVLGTKFNIKTYKDEDVLYATLAEGSISYFSQKNKAKFLLKPGEQIKEQSDGTTLLKKVNINNIISWKDGLYCFENITLEEMMNTLSRWYDINVFYENSHLKNLHFTGDLKRYNNIQTFLDFLEEGGDVRFTVRSKTIIISEK